MRTSRSQLTLLAGVGVLVSTLLVVSGPSADAGTYVPANPAAVTINDNSTASPSPSVIELYGASTAITDLDVTLTGLTHGYPRDLDIELVGPDGTALVLMSDACGLTSDALSGVTLSFDDSAAAMESDPSAPCSGAYRPTNLDIGPADVWHTTPNATSLSAFNGKNPNGFWYLHVRDDAPAQAGQIAGGWSLTITTAGTAPVAVPGSGGAGSGPATTYPIQLPVSGRSGPVTDVNVTLPGLFHGAARDLDVLLVGPTGATVMLMSDMCGAGDPPLTNATLTFDDQAPGPLGDTAPTCSSGRYRPTNPTGPDGLPAPAPSEPYGTSLAAFNGTDANGTWQLFLNDDSVFDSGFLSAAPTLEIATADIVAPTTVVTKRPKSSGKTRAKIVFSASEGAVTFRCKVDRKKWASCSSPLKLKRLKVGPHKVLIQATDAAGNVEAAPTAVAWRVKRR